MNNNRKSCLGVRLPKANNGITLEAARSDHVHSWVAVGAQDDVCKENICLATKNTQNFTRSRTNMSKKRHTFVSFEGLDNFLGLQVPDDYLVVLRATDDPFASSDREIGKDAVLLVLTSHIRLETLALVEIPQFQRAENENIARKKQTKLPVKGGRENVLSVGRELDKGNRRILVI